MPSPRLALNSRLCSSSWRTVSTVSQGSNLGHITALLEEVKLGIIINIRTETHAGRRRNADGRGSRAGDDGALSGDPRAGAPGGGGRVRFDLGLRSPALSLSRK